MLIPGADRSGFNRLLPSTSTGPRLLKFAIWSVGLVAPTTRDAWYTAGGSDTVLQLLPVFPALATTTIPAARVFSTTVLSVSTEQPSDGGQPQELLITCGAMSGSGFWPKRSVGATNH